VIDVNFGDGEIRVGEYVNKFRDLGRKKDEISHKGGKITFVPSHAQHVTVFNGAF
jgi:hypothetical protein